MNRRDPKTILHVTALALLGGCGYSRSYVPADTTVDMRAAREQFTRVHCLTLGTIDTRSTRYQGNPAAADDGNVAAFTNAWRSAFEGRVPVQVVPPAQVAACEGLVAELEVSDLYSDVDGAARSERRRSAMRNLRYMPIGNGVNAGALAMALFERVAYEVDMVLVLRPISGGDAVARVRVEQRSYLGQLFSPIEAYRNVGREAGEKLALIVGSLIAP